MPMTTANTPHLREQPAMADSKSAPTKSPAPAKQDAKPAAAPARDLAPAGQSGDPEVQKLLAEREIHRLNAEPAEDADAEARRDASTTAIDEIDKKLADLGYTAK